MCRSVIVCSRLGLFMRGALAMSFDVRFVHFLHQPCRHPSLGRHACMHTCMQVRVRPSLSGLEREREREMHPRMWLLR